MLIEIRQEFLPVETAGSPWALQPFQATVWRYAGSLGQPEVFAVSCPIDFAPGLLAGYVDGKPVPLADLDRALAAIGTTRIAIQAGL
jgi:hypothetical protein